MEVLQLPHVEGPAGNRLGVNYFHNMADHNPLVHGTVTRTLRMSAASILEKGAKPGADELDEDSFRNLKG